VVPNLVHIVTESLKVLKLVPVYAATQADASLPRQRRAYNIFVIKEMAQF